MLDEKGFRVSKIKQKKWAAGNRKKKDKSSQLFFFPENHPAKFREIPRTQKEANKLSKNLNISSLDFMLMSKEVQDKFDEGYNIFAVDMPNSEIKPRLGRDESIRLPIVGNSYGDILVLSGFVS